ncbi:MAG: MarR family transcriptional regulator [Paenibacillaceae bacterium]|nr:MarR family transcriptional regulator [Paenibacillaceae bacterium]
MPQPNERMKLDNQLCFLLYASSRALTRLYQPLLDELGITYPQYLALLVLWERETATVSELGARLELDSGTLTPMLKRMEAAGLVVRERDPLDERRVVVRLTAAGVALQEQASCLPEKLLAGAGGTEAEALELLGTLRRLLGRLKAPE